jgi:peptidylprolyl isomerase
MVYYNGAGEILVRMYYMNTRLFIVGLVVVIIVLSSIYFVSSPSEAPVSLSDTPTSEQTEEQQEARESNDATTTETEDTPMTDITKFNLITSQEGTGAAAKAGDTITVHYTGTLLDGTKFDSSLDRGTPFSFQLGAGMVIAGWDQGLIGTKVGQKLRLEIPSEMAYGDRAVSIIPANSGLIFEVEVLEIK